MSVKSVIFVRLLTAGFGDCAIINCLISPVIISYNDRNGLKTWIQTIQSGQVRDEGSLFLGK